MAPAGGAEPGEFELIARHFTWPPFDGPQSAASPIDAGFIRQAVGDDCAVIAAGESDYTVTSDLLLEGRHFLPGVDPESLGHKALAVNLSDLAAAGSTPRAFWLALALPRADDAWLAAFARGMRALAAEHGCSLAGGDTTRAPTVAGADGPITVCITALGSVPRGTALSRAGARPGDELWVSGTLGDGLLGLWVAQGTQALDEPLRTQALAKHHRPAPRVALGQALRGVASACIDVSDGLLGDLGHVLERSGVGATVEWGALPLSPAVRTLAPTAQRECALAGGDEYELLFSAPAGRAAQVRAAAAQAGTPVTRIGRIEAAEGLRVVDADGRALDLAGLAAFDHFAPGR